MAAALLDQQETILKANELDVEKPFKRHVKSDVGSPIFK